MKEREKLNNQKGEVLPLPGRKEFILSLFAILIGAGIIASLSVKRNFFTYGTETDYLGGFVKIADQFMKGEPLDLKFHPPLYPITLGFIQSIVRDWFMTGLILSWISCLIVLCTGYLFIYQLFGSYPAWGALVGMITSGVFISYSAQATSDLFFLALYSSSFFLFLHAVNKESNKYWLFSGLMVGFALITRTNSLTLLTLLAFPFIQSSSRKSRLTSFGWVGAGVLIPLLLWTSFALYTGSKIWPSENYMNLALTYFSQGADRITGDARAIIEGTGNFNSIVDVLKHDPAHIAITYIRDIFNNIQRIFSHNSLVVFPFNLFALPGIFILFLADRRYSVFLYLFATLLQFALVNFKAYELRYYMFLIPLFGAGAGFCVKKVFDGISSKMGKFFIVLFLLIFIGAGTVKSATKAHKQLHSQDIEFEEAVPQLIKHISPMNTLVVRKPHLPYYANCVSIWFPPAKTHDDLHEALRSEFSGNTIYLYYGAAEQRARPELSDLASPDANPAWLVPIAQSHIPGKWVLYRFNPDF